MDYYSKYLKYKQKYLNIKLNLMLGGSKNIIIKSNNQGIIDELYDHNDAFNISFYRIKFLQEQKKVNIVNREYFYNNDTSKKIFTIDNVDIVFMDGYINILIISDSTCISISNNSSNILSFELLNNEKIINYDNIIETNLRYIDILSSQKFIYKNEHINDENPFLYNENTHLLEYKILNIDNIDNYLIKKDIIVPKEKSYSKKYSNITFKSANELVVNDIFDWYGGSIEVSEVLFFHIKFLPIDKKVIIQVCGKKYTITDVDTIWLGCGDSGNLYSRRCEHFDNNSILIIAKNTYTLIDGIEMYKFKLFDNEEVIYYESVYENASYGYIETNIRYIDIFCSQKFVYKSDYENYININGDSYCLEGEYTHPFEHIKISPDMENDENINNSKKKSKNDRPSPAESATLFEIGTIKKGNDGNMWIITETKSGVKRWSKVKN
jgi:hypothetical protein